MVVHTNLQLKVNFFVIVTNPVTVCLCFHTTISSQNVTLDYAALHSFKDRLDVSQLVNSQMYSDMRNGSQFDLVEVKNISVPTGIFQLCVMRFCDFKVKNEWFIFRSVAVGCIKTCHFPADDYSYIFEEAQKQFLKLFMIMAQMPLYESHKN